MINTRSHGIHFVFGFSPDPTTNWGMNSSVTCAADDLSRVMKNYDIWQIGKMDPNAASAWKFSIRMLKISRLNFLPLACASGVFIVKCAIQCQKVTYHKSSVVPGYRREAAKLLQDHDMWLSLTKRLFWHKRKRLLVHWGPTYYLPPMHLSVCVCKGKDAAEGTVRTPREILNHNKSHGNQKEALAVKEESGI